jgi:iron complex outermembrane receptor protein
MSRTRFTLPLLAGTALVALSAASALGQEQENGAGAPQAPIVLAQAVAPPVTSSQFIEVQVTSRRVTESVQKVPVAVSVTSADTVANTGAYNVSRLSQQLPSLTLYSQNPRNTSVNIRGLGAPLGLTNDGIEQGVGIYIDQVYYNRVAASTLDFVDIQQIEVLRGPQGTLYGKNTTAGAINITTRAPSFEFEARGEISGGNYDFKQAKASISGPITDDVAFRLSVANTTRRGTVYNVATRLWNNGQDNLGVRGTVLWNATPDLKFTVSADYNVQDAICCAAYYARVGTSQRALNRQYASLAAAQGYTVPSTNPFDRITDIDADLRARNEHGGASLVGEWVIGGGLFTSVTAWRYWDWGPSNDRDYTGLPITPLSQNPTLQNQYTQEFRYSYEGDGYDFVVGLFGFNQGIHTTGTEGQGPSASRWTLNPGNVASGAPGCGASAANQRACNPAVLNNLIAENDIRLKATSAALFGKLNWNVTDALTISPGIRFNYDGKSGHYRSTVTGTASDGTRQLVLYTGPYANDPWIAEQRGQRAPIFYAPTLAKSNVSYDLNVSYQFEEDLLGYATYSKGYKSGGINLNGVPVDANNQPIAAAYTVKPEDVSHYEAGVKSQFLDNRATLNVSAFWTVIKDYQANVNNGALGLVRGYLANAKKAQVRGVEAEFTIFPTEGVSAYANGTFNDHSYVEFTDAPCPIELSGGTTVTGNQVPGAAGVPGALSPANCDVSGQWLPGISKWSFSWGGELSEPVGLWGKQGEIYFGYDASYRSKFSSNASRSIYMDVDAYALHNFRVGYRTSDGINLSLWVRNAFDENYFDQLLAAPGNTGLIAGIPADPRTWGATLRYEF